MSNLLASNYRRMFKSIVFWLCVGSILIINGAVILYGCMMYLKAADIGASSSIPLERFYFFMQPFLGGFIVAFSSMFIGTEYSDGTLRNKIIVGKTRGEVFAANYITVFSAAMIMNLVWALTGLCGLFVFKQFAIRTPAEMCQIFIIMTLYSAAICAIMLCLNMNMSNKSASVIISIVVIVAMLIVGIMMYNSLQQPEMTSGVTMTLNGIEMTDPQPNPSYISGTKRIIYEHILDLLPGGQAMLVFSAHNIEHPYCMMIYSAVLTLVFTLFGYALFRRKDIN